MSRTPELLYKDKIEVSLDGRQIFYLFFGGAVIVGLVFVLGVMVGRRVEARGHVDRARTTTAADPLAALDRLESNGGMSFKGSLMGAPANSDVERQINEIEKARKPEPPPAPAAVLPPAPVHAAPPPAPKVEAKPEPKKAEEAKPEPKKAEEPKPEKKAEAKTEDKKAEEKKSEDKKTEDKKADKSDEEKKPKYVLQLSSFQERSEAEAFLAQVKEAGFSPFITEGTVNGTKFYRVRMGSYRSLEAANDAKSDIEKTLKKSASVMKL